MSSSDWQVMLARARLTPSDFREDRRYLLGANHGWWDPQQPASLPTAQRELAAGRILDLGVDHAPGDHVTVYLVWHET